MEMTQEVWDRIVALESRAAAQAEKLEALENKTATVEASVAKIYIAKTASAPEPAVAAAPVSYGHPSLLKRLDKHGIRLQPEDMDDFDGSGSEKYNEMTDWTKAGGEGKTYPGMPTQEQADAAVAQGQ